MTTTLTTYSTTNVLLTTEVIAQINTYLEAHAQTGRFSGNVVITQGEGEGRAIARSYGQANREHRVSNNPQTKFRIGSVTKQLTAIAILQLQERGLLNVQSSISTYLPDYPQGDQITVHHLLTHTSGIPEYLNPALFPDFLDWMRLSTTLDQLVDRFRDLPLEFEPGERFRYGNSGYVLLTQIIETVSAQTYADYLQANLFDPLGLSNTGYEIPLTVTPDLAQGYLFLGGDTYLQTSPLDMSIPQGAGGLYSTGEDLAKWNHWLFGEGSDQAVLSDAARAMLLIPAVKMELEKIPDAFYSYGLVLDTHLERQRIHHVGGISGFDSALTYYPDDRLTIVVLSNLETAATGQIAEGLAAIVFERVFKHSFKCLCHTHWQQNRNEHIQEKHWNGKYES
ncbi:MAG: serine hydrolase domain-containing protein, partial [Phormidesmis sp.]